MDSKKNGMGSALMNMIRKNKKKDSSNQEEKSSSSSSDSSSEILQKMFIELKSISKRLDDLEGCADTTSTNTTTTTTTRNKKNIRKKQSIRTQGTRKNAPTTSAKRVIEAYDRRRLQRLVRKRNEE